MPFSVSSEPFQFVPPYLDFFFCKRESELDRGPDTGILESAFTLPESSLKAAPFPPTMG